MTYVINVDYSTGDSENTWDKTDELAATWEDLDAAKLALQWVKEHYLYYQKYSNDICIDDRAKNLNIDDIQNKPWFFKHNQTAYNPLGNWEHSMLLKLDNGSLFIVKLPHIGYFEHPTAMYITLQQEVVDNDMRVEF